MGRRTLLLIAALVVAALGTVLVFLYAQNADKRATESQALVTVIVAKTTISTGTTGSAAASAGAFEEKQIPKDTSVPGALSSATPLQDLVALTTIYPGQQIIQQQWGTADQVSGLGLPEGKIALTISLGDPERVAGFVNPGSTVAIFATGGPEVRVLLSDITVLGVGAVTANPSSDTTNSNQNVSSALITLALDQEQATKILTAKGLAKGGEYNGLYFALMDDKSVVKEGAPGIPPANLFN